MKQGDLIFSRVGSVDRCTYANENNEGWLFSGRCLRVRPQECVDSMWLYYFFCLESTKTFIRNIAVGATMPSINTKLMCEVPVKYPPLAEQQRIAKILSSLDDKIELNNAINRNLEEQAQAIFKSWFVDFEPFGGEMPADWKETSLGEVCLKVTDGSHFSPQDDPSAPYPMFSVKDMETYGFNPTNCKHISAEDFEKMKAGDCVPKIDDVLVAKDGSYLKEIFICSEAREEAILSSIAIFRPNKSKILPEILLFLLKQPSVRKDVGDNFVSGSALPRIVLKDFKKYHFILPSMQIQQKLVKMLNSIRMEIHNNVDENQRLSVLRDFLLPRLMSGELGC
jgi:type I restriction enzyme S subunit